MPAASWGPPRRPTPGRAARLADGVRRATLCPMALDEDFESAQVRVKGLPKTPAPDELLELYALYKQATLGDVTGARPSRLDFKGRAKYDAWAQRKGIAPDDAKRAYVECAQRLQARYRG